MGRGKGGVWETEVIGGDGQGRAWGMGDWGLGTGDWGLGNGEESRVQGK